MKKGEITLSAICLAFFLFMFYQAIALHGVGRFGEVGSGFWPLFSLSFCLLTSAIWLVRNLRQYAKEKGKTVAVSTPEEAAALWSRRRKVLSCIACILIYILLTPLVGFILSTILFILAFILALDEKRTWVLILSPILITAVVVIIFAKFITIALPKGVGIFAAFSRFFY